MSENPKLEKIPLRDGFSYIEGDNEMINLLGRSLMATIQPILGTDDGVNAFRKLFGNDEAEYEALYAKAAGTITRLSRISIIYTQDNKIADFGGYYDNPFVNIKFSDTFGIIFPEFQNKKLGIDLAKLITQSALTHSQMDVVLGIVRNDNTPSLNMNRNHIIPYFQGLGYQVQVEELEQVTKFKYFPKR